MGCNAAKKIVFGWLLFLLVQLNNKVYGQSYNPLFFKQYTKSYELPSFSCSGIYKDNYGFLWIANSYGISIFNGTEFSNISVYSDRKDFYLGDSPEYFLQLDSNRLLITSTNGFFIFEYQTKKIEKLDIQLVKAPEGKIEIIGFNKKHDKVIVKAGNIIYFFDSSLHQTGFIECVNESKDVYVRNQYTGASCFYYTAGGRLASVNIETGVIDSLLYMPGLKSIVINGQNDQKYIIVTSRWVMEMDQRTKSIIKRKPMPAQKVSGIDFFPRTVRQDNDGNYWIGGEAGFFIYKPLTQDIDELDGAISNVSSKKINSYTISDIWIDKESAFAVSYAGGGLIEFKKDLGRFKDYCLPENMNAGTYSMVVHKDCVLGANDLNGLYKFPLNKKEITYTYCPVSETDGSILQIEKLDEDNIWVLFNENFKIGVIDAERMAVRHEKLEINNITSKFFNSSNNYRMLNRDFRPLIKKTNEGLSYITVGRSLYRVAGTVKTGLKFNFVDSIVSTASISSISGGNRFILGSTKGELFSLEKNRLIRKTGALNDFFLAAKSIETDARGNIYLMTANGIYVYDSLFSIKKHLIKPDVGLLDNKIFGGKIDNHDILWMATTGGITAYNTLTGQLVNYPVEGITRNKRFISKAVSFEDDWIYFGGTEGITAINTKMAEADTIKKSVLYFDEIRNGNTILHSGLTPGSLKNNYVFSYDNNSFAFSFKSICYQQKEGSYFRYKLAGFDTSWKLADEGKKLNFLSLSPGKYELFIKEIYPDNKQGSMISYSFVIGKPFWKTIIFFILATVILAALIVLTVVFIIRKKLEEQRIKVSLQIALKNERERISQDLHDDLGSGLTSIKLLSNAMLSKKEGSQFSGTLDDIGKISGNMIDQMSEIIWVLNNTDDTFSGLLSHVRIYIANYIVRTQLNLKFTISSTVENYYITSTRRRNLLLVIKEGFHNIVKHSQATEFSIDCSAERGLLEIIIRDNGKGYNENAFSPGNGLPNITRRIKAIGGTVVFKADNGAQIIITLPD